MDVYPQITVSVIGNIKSWVLLCSVSRAGLSFLKSGGSRDNFSELQMPADIYNKYAENVWTYRRNRNFMEKELLKVVKEIPEEIRLKPVKISKPYVFCLPVWEKPKEPSKNFDLLS